MTSTAVQDFKLVSTITLTSNIRFEIHKQARRKALKTGGAQYKKGILKNDF